MTSDELAVVIKDFDHGGYFPPHQSTEVATLRATLEVAYQLAILNENNTLANCAATSNGALCVSVRD